MLTSMSLIQTLMMDPVQMIQIVKRGKCSSQGRYSRQGRVVQRVIVEVPEEDSPQLVEQLLGGQMQVPLIRNLTYEVLLAKI